MSGFLGNLLNRHTNANKLVLPRAYTRFEPHKVFLPNHDLNVIAKESVNHHKKQENCNFQNFNVTKPTDNLAAKAKGDNCSTEQSVHEQSLPIIGQVETKEPVKEKEIPYNSLPEHVVRQVFRGSGDKNKDNGYEKKNVIPIDSTKESVAHHKNTSREMTSIYNTKSNSDYKRLLPESKEDNKGKPVKQDNPIEAATVSKKDEVSMNRQLTKHQTVGPEKPLPSSMNPAKPKIVKTKSQNTINPLPNTDIVSQEGTKILPRLSGIQRDTHKSIFVKDSKTKTEPVINVTIGRIEVRAIPFQPLIQPECKKKSSPIMSLDKYLRQQIQRGNR